MISQAGSILLFSGSWRDRVSRWIKIGTCSRYTHVAGEATITQKDLRDAASRREKAKKPLFAVPPESWKDGVYLFESTSQCVLPCCLQGKVVSGVQVHPVTERLIDYFPGQVWIRNPRQPLTENERILLAIKLLDAVGTPYDFSGAAVSATWLLKYWFGRRKAENTKELYCSEVVLDVYQFALYDRIATRMISGSAPPRTLARWQRKVFTHPKRIQ